MHHGTGGEGFLCDALSLVKECAHAVDMLAKIVLAGTEHGTTHLNGVGKARQNGVYLNRVAVGHVEAGKVELANVIYRIFAACLTVDTYCLGVGIACERTCIFEKRGYRLVLLHLVEHRTLHLARNVDKTVVGSYHDYVAFGKTHVARKATVENVVVDIDHCDESTATIHLDVTQRTEFVGAASHIKGVEHCGECRQRVCAWQAYLAHDIDHDGACLTYSETHAATGVTAAERRAQTGIGLCHGES